MVIAHCINCNKEMRFKSPSLVHNFCSRSCSNKSRSGEKRVKTKRFICEVCGKEFRINESQVRNRTKTGSKIRFCSRECMKKNKMIRNLKIMRRNHKN